MVNFLKTAVVLMVAFIITEVVAMFFFQNATHVVLNTNSVTLSSVLVSFFIYIVSAVITFLFFSSEDTVAHILIIWALIGLCAWFFNEVPFKYAVFGYVPVVISVVLAKVIASKIRSSFLRKKD